MRNHFLVEDLDSRILQTYTQISTLQADSVTLYKPFKPRYPKAHEQVVLCQA